MAALFVILMSVAVIGMHYELVVAADRHLWWRRTGEANVRQIVVTFGGVRRASAEKPVLSNFGI